MADASSDPVAAETDDLGAGSSADAELLAEMMASGDDRTPPAGGDLSLDDFGADSSERPVQLIGGSETAEAPNFAEDDTSGSVTTSDFHSNGRRRSGAGLGAIDPWGSELSDEPTTSPGVGLSFEEGPGTADEPRRNGVIGDFELDAEEWEPPPVPPAGNEPAFDDFKKLDQVPADRNGINIIEAPIEQLERSASAIPEAFDAIERKVREESDSLRGRFSRLGARFGLGGEDEPEPIDAAEAQPSSKLSSGDCLEDLIARTQTRLDGRSYRDLDEREQQQYLHDHVNLRLFYLVNEQSERALDAIPGIPPAEQEFWQQMFWSLVQYRDVESTPDRRERATQTALQLRAALQRLQESARLQIRNASFCRRINGFGSYDRFERDVFRPGQPVLVYAEIDNFKTEPTAAGQHRTLLRSTLRIFPENGSEKPVDSVTLRAVEDVCRSPRRDYFNSYEFTIPNDIAPGRYLLEITIDDQLAKKAARQTVLFSVK